MSKVVHKKGTKTLTVSTDQVLDTFDITNCNGFSLQVNGITLTAGSIQLQYSNDNTTWANLGTSVALGAGAVANVINQAGIYTGHIRVLITISAGPGDYNYFLLGKEN
jgi:hypothetical protein